MPVDNQIYDRLAADWWSADSSFYLLRSLLNPARFPYLRRTMTETLAISSNGAHVLDVGCGGGLLAEEFAKLGCRVTGVDPSEPSLRTAAEHARSSGLSIDYVPGSGEHLPFENEAFDVVYCCDVLEHVDDLQKTIGEIARVIKPGGGFMFDTINRTLRSKLVMIKLFQEWKPTALMEPSAHDWNMFIRPDELIQHLNAAGLKPGPIVGVAPKAPPPKVVWLLRQRKRGAMNFEQLGAAIGMHESSDKSVLYMGYAVKQPVP